MSAHVIAVAASGSVANRPVNLPREMEECWEETLQIWDEVPTRFHWAGYQAVGYEELAGEVVRRLAQPGPVSRLVLATVAPDISMTTQPAMALLRITNEATQATAAPTADGTLSDELIAQGNACAAHRIAPALAVTDQGPLTTLTALRLAASAVAEGSSALVVAADRANLPYSFIASEPACGGHDPDARAVAVRLEHSGERPGVLVLQGTEDSVTELCARAIGASGVSRFGKVIVTGLAASAVREIGVECDQVVAADPVQQATGLLTEANEPGINLLIAVDATRQRAAVAVLPIASA